MTGGWMRATSPSGDASFEGVVQWTGDLGMGVRAPKAARARIATTRPPVLSNYGARSSVTSTRSTSTTTSAAFRDR